jgi:hypothetical protein
MFSGLPNPAPLVRGTDPDPHQFPHQNDTDPQDCLRVIKVKIKLIKDKVPANTKCGDEARFRSLSLSRTSPFLHVSVRLRVPPSRRGGGPSPHPLAISFNFTRLQWY